MHLKREKGDCPLFSHDKIRKVNMDKFKRIEKALDNLSGLELECRLCPQECRVNRRAGQTGICQSTNEASLSHALLHFGEEPVLSGIKDCAKAEARDTFQRSGSGTIFFSGCNLKCLFCQNYQLSWLNQGKAVSDEELAGKMLYLQEKGGLNINLVSPTHLLLPILRALRIALEQGLELPIVYNSNGYEKAEVIENLEGIIDIYLPDLKYFSPEVAGRFSSGPDYFEKASLAVKEMHRQQPELLLSEKEVALKGLIIRHLVLPGQVEDSLSILDWIAQNLHTSVCLSLMSQYHPCFKAPAEIQRSLTPEDYGRVITRAEELGFETIFIQPEPFAETEHLVPDFNLKDPFKWS
jgi:putative pyruvate formate lyase activating enzyme